MSQEWLSQQEVDALLKGVCDSEYWDDTDDDSSKVKVVDLTRQERVIRGRMPMLEMINERFSRNCNRALNKLIGRRNEISIGPVRVQKYAEFLRNLVIPNNFNVFSASSLTRNGLLVIDPNLLFLFIDNSFGGDGRFHTRIEGRNLNHIEMNFLKLVSDTIMKSYSKSFSYAHEVEFSITDHGTNYNLMDFAEPTEIVVVTTFTVEMSGNTADMHMCLSYRMIEPIKKILDCSLLTIHEKDSKMVNVEDIDVELADIVNVGTITLGKLQTLSVNDVILFDSPQQLVKKEIQ